MEADEKKCPRCAETVKLDAKVCRHCGLNFVTGAAPTAKGPVKAGMGTGGKLGIGCLGVVAVLFLIGMLVPSRPGGSAGSEVAASSKPPIVVSARELAAAYEANEAAAQQTYGGRPLQVSAQIQSIDLDFSDKPYLVLVGPNQFLGPQAKLTEESQARAGSLSKGQAVNLLCESVSEVIGTPMLDSCTIQ